MRIMAIEAMNISVEKIENPVWSILIPSPRAGAAVAFNIGSRLGFGVGSGVKTLQLLLQRTWIVVSSQAVDLHLIYDVPAL